MRLNPVLEALGEYPIVEIQNIARRIRDAGERLIDFSLGDPREPTPEFIREALRDAVPEVSQYPTVAGLLELREAVAAYVRRRFGVEVDPATQIVPVSGAKEAIFTTPLAFIDRDHDDGRLCSAPRATRSTSGASCSPGERRSGCNSPATSYCGPATSLPPPGPGCVCCGPVRRTTPPGRSPRCQDLRDLYAACREHDTILCSDEPYIDLYEGEPPHSALEVAGPGSPGVLSFFSCSKRSGMTGYRTGAIVGDAAAIAALKSLRSSVGVSSPEFVQKAAAAAWSDDDHVAIRRDIFTAKRRVLRTKFEEDGIRGGRVGRAGLYLWVQVDDDVAATKRLLAEGVVVSPGRAFGPGGEGHIRLRPGAHGRRVLGCGRGGGGVSAELIDVAFDDLTRLDDARRRGARHHRRPRPR